MRKDDNVIVRAVMGLPVRIGRKVVDPPRPVGPLWDVWVNRAYRGRYALEGNRVVATSGTTNPRIVREVLAVILMGRDR